MAGRPWYAQGADLFHRLAVLGILGYSGYLCYGIGTALKHNYETKQRRLLLKQDEPESQILSGETSGSENKDN